jgi:hypothetical protein
MTLINIKQGGSTTIPEIITGLITLAGYTAKLYIYTQAGAQIAVVTGTILSLTVTYDILNATSKNYPVGLHIFETKLFDGAGHVYTPSEGLFNVERTIITTPV